MHSALDRVGTERAALLFDGMSQGVVFQDRTGTIVVANPAAERILGLTMDEMLGRTSFDARWRSVREDGSDFPGQEHPSMVALRTGRPVHDVIMGVFRPCDGQYRWIRISAVPQFRESDSEPVEVFTTFDDITELKGLERALRKSEERFRIAAECSNDSLYEWHLDTDEVEYFGRNRLGLPEGGWVTARYWFDRLHPEEREGIAAELQQSLRERRLYCRQHRLADGFGGWRHCETRGQALYDDEGTPIRWIGASSDITDHVEALESLKQTVNLFEAVVEGTTDPIFVKSVEGRYLLANQACADRFGQPVSHVLGKTNFELTSAEIAEHLRIYDVEVVTTGRTVTFEATGPGTPGPRQYLITKFPYRDTSGTIVGIVGIARDLTDMKRLEAEYRQAQKMEAIGRLAGGIAHDFNNLLTVILGYIDDVPTPVGGTGSEALAEVKAAAERAARLTSQLLAFSRRQVLQAEPTDLNALITNVDRMLGRVLGEPIQLRTQLAPDAGAARVDRGQFEQVIINLAVNARDAMPQGGRLTISTRNYDLTTTLAGERGLPAGPYVMVTVTDTGQGMDRELLSRIFEPFFTTKDQAGTGLGLSTVYGIVKQSGGDVWVQSQPGIGTTFQVLLPRVDPPEAVGVTSPSPQPDPATAKGTILLVEDEERLRALLKTVLERQGYTVHVCGDVPDASAWLAAHEGSLDLVLTDMVMPHGNGLELEQIARAVRPELRLLFMSGYTEHAITDTGQLPAGTHFIQKPFTPSALAQKVREILRHAGASKPRE